MAAAEAKQALDLTKNNPFINDVLTLFHDNLVGQEPAVEVVTDMVESYLAGFSVPDRPAGNALFLGPTGSGKTHLVECLAKALYGNHRAMIKIDCAEFQHSHEIAKLVGSPPGYLGHRETHPMLTQEALDQYHTEKMKVSILLFDEIEKSSDSLWNLLLGILDKATLTLGDNRRVDFSKAMIFMTSNLGAREMANRGIGFTEVEEEKDKVRLEQISISAARSRFSPEFMNRLEHIVTFHTLSKEQMEKVLDIELEDLLFNLRMSCALKFSFVVSPAAKRTLLNEGYSKEYGARFLKRAIGRRIEKPLAKLVITEQIKAGDKVIIDDLGNPQFEFYRQPLSESYQQQELNHAKS